MKTNNKTQSLVIWILIIGLFLIYNLISCTVNSRLANNVERKIIIFTQCSSQEASSDIIYSINNLKDRLENKRISVITDHQKKQCGYLLVDGTKAKKITGALTDFELSEEIESFFK